MQSIPIDQYEKPVLENINRQLLENQSFLFEENQKLQKDVMRLSNQLNQLKATTVNPELFDALQKGKNNLLALNETLKSKIKILRSPPVALDQFDLQKENREKNELMKTVQDLDEILHRVKNIDKPPIKEPKDNLDMSVEILRKKLEESEKKREELNETVRKQRSDDEKYILREKITDMKQLISELQVENTKLKYESEQYADEVENYKKQLSDATEEGKVAMKRAYQLEEEKDDLKDQISTLENEKIAIKKEMIEEMNEANRAKRVLVDTEIALQHISEAFENKRMEVRALTNQLDEAEKIIKGFRKQFHLEL